MTTKKAKPKASEPKFKKIILHPRPDESVARAALMIEPPKGYAFLKVDRTKTRAVVTFVRIAAVI